MGVHDLDEALGLNDRRKAALNITTSLDRNPDEEAKKQSLQKATGTPSELMDDPAIRKEAERQARMQAMTFDASPALVGFAANENNARLITDDIPFMTAFETKVKGLKKFWTDVIEPTPARALVAARQGVGGAYSFVGENILQPFIDVLTTEGMKEKYGRSNFLSIMGKNMTDEAKMVEKQIQAEHPVDPNSPAGWTSSALQSMYLQGPLMGAGMLAGSAKLATGAVLTGMGLTTGGQTYGDRRAKGFGLGSSAASALWDATVEVGTEIMPVKIMFDMMKPAAKMAFSKLALKIAELYGSEMLGESTATFLQDANDKFMDTPGMLLGDRIAKIGEYISSGEAFQNWVNTIGSTAIQTTLMGGAGMAINRFANRAQKAKDGQAALIETMTAAEQSKLFERAPDKFADYVQRVGDQHGLSTIYLQADRAIEEGIKQGLTEEQIPAWLGQYGVAMQDLHTAIQTGGLLSLDFGKVAAGFNNDAVLQSLQNEMMVDPTRAAAADTEASAKIQSEHLEHLDDMYKVDQANKIGTEDIDAWKEAVLNTPGLRGRVTMESLIPLIARANVLHTLTGIPAIEHLNRMLQSTGLQAMKYADFQEQKSGGILGQSANNIESPEFKAWFGDSKVVDESGKPLVVYHGTVEDFTEFDNAMLGKNTGAKNSILGHFFTDDPYVSSTGFAKGRGHVLPVHLKLENPFNFFVDITRKRKTSFGTEVPTRDARGQLEIDWDKYATYGGTPYQQLQKMVAERSYKEVSELESADYLQFKTKLQELGYDGIILPHVNTDAQAKLHGMYIAFNPTQIKSVNNRGTYDPNDPNILHQSTGDVLGNPLRGFVSTEEAEGRVRRKVNREKGVGAPSNARTKIKGKDGKEVILGRITHQDWMTRVQANLSPEELKNSREWYSQLHDTLEPIAGADAPRWALAWLMSQKNTSPSKGMLNVLRARDLAAGKKKIKIAGLNEKALVAVMYGGLPQGGLGAKLLDFVDSELGQEWRTYMGEDPLGRHPAAIDIWAQRDVGFVDDTVQAWVKKTFGKKAANALTRDKAAASETSYEYGIDFYNDQVDYLNKKKFDGGGWSAREVQAVGWVTMQRVMGVQAEFVSDIIDKNVRRVSLGLAPGKGSALAGHLMGKEISPAAAQKAIADIADLAGVKVLSSEVGVGAFLTDPEGCIQIDSFASPEAVADFRAMLGYAFQQDSVISTRAMKSGSNTAYDVFSPEFGDNDKAHRFFDEFLKHVPRSKKDKFPIAPGYQQITTSGGPATGIRFLNFKGQWGEARIKSLEIAVNKAAAATGIKIERAECKNVDFEETKNEWVDNKNGQLYINDLLERGRLQEAEQLSSRYSPSRFDLAQTGEFFQTARRGTAPDAQRARSNPEHAISAVGVHYSKSPREELSSAFFGTGAASAESARLTGQPDLQERLYLYLNVGRGIHKEPGVGSHPHRVQLDNLYDMTVDPLQLRTGRSANDFERAVMAQGFDGYFDRDYGFAVLLGPRTIKVDSRDDANVPEVAPAKFTPAQLLSKELRSNMDLPGGALTGPRWVESLQEDAPELYAKLDEAGFIEPLRTYNEKIRRAEIPFVKDTLFQSGFQEPRLAPNGRRSNLTEAQWKMVRTPEFKRWFGDWEKHAKSADPVSSLWSDDSVSKAVDANGEPQVFYHGTTSAGFTEFEGGRKIPGAYFFSNNRRTAHTYSGRGDTITVFGEDADASRGIYEVFLNTRNPLEENFEGANWDGTRVEQYQVVDEDGDQIYSDEGRGIFDYDTAQKLAEEKNGEVEEAPGMYQSTDSAVREAMRWGHDGAIIREVVDDGGEADSFDTSDVCVVFKSENIKSATSNIGTFDPDSPSILEQKQNANPLGALTITSSGNLVSLFESSDKSTFLHEAGHIFLADLKYVAETLGVQTAEWDKVKEWLGVGPDGVITREMHEKFAEHFEVYLKEGQAPTLELRNAFRKFKRWLNAIYEMATSKRTGQRNNITISPEIAELFDRLLATEEEIQTARAQAALIAMLDEKLLNETGFTPAQVAEYRNIVAQAEDSAGEKRDKHKLIGRPERLTGWRKQATEEAAKVPVYAFIAKMKDIGVSRKSIIDQYGSEGIPDSSPMFKGNSLDINVAIAEYGKEFGFENAGSFVGDLRATPPQKLWIQKRTAQLEAQYDNQQDTQEAIRTASLRRQLEIESQWLAKQAEKAALEHDKKQAEVEQKWKDAERDLAEAIAIGKREEEIRALKEKARAAKDARDEAFKAYKSIPRAAMRSWAEKVIGERTMGKIQNVGQMLAESRRHRQKAIAFARQGKWAEALQANERARLTEELIIASYRAINKWKKMSARWKQIAKWTNDNKSVKVGEKFRDQINRLLNQYEIASKTFNLAAPDLHSFASSLAEDLDGSDTSLPPWVGVDLTKYSKLNWQQLQDLGDALNYLYGHGREEVEGLKTSSGRRVADYAADIEARQADLKGLKNLKSDATRIGRVVQGIQKGYRSFFANTGILRFIAQRLDGFTNVGGHGTIGPAEQLVQNIINGMGKSNDMWQEISARIEPQLKILTTNADKVFGDIRLPELFQRYGMSWTKGRVVAAALNMGNASNLQRLGSGYELNDDDIHQIANKLTAEEWTAIQSIWDTIQTLWPQIADTHERLNFFRPKKIEPQALKVHTADGQVLSLPGGYYPAIYDKSLDREIAQWTEKDDILASHDAILQIPVAKSGATKARADIVKRPLNLSLAVLGRHFNDMIRYITLSEAVRDADRVFRNKDLVKRNLETIGREMQDMIRPALKQTLRPDPKDIGWFENARVKMSIYYMGYNAWTALQNITGVFPAIYQVGMRNYLNGLGHVLKMGNPYTAYKAMLEASTYMRLREGNVERDLKSQLRDFTLHGMEINGKRYNYDDVKSLGFAAIRFIDGVVSLPAWWGKYHEGLETHGDMQKAIEAADAAVNQALGSGLSVDSTGFGRHRFFSLLAPFMSFASTQQEVLATERTAWKEGKMTTPEFLYGQLMTWVMPAVMSTFMQGALMYGLVAALGGGDDKKKKDVMDYLTDLISYRLMGIPFIRDFYNAILQGFEKKAPITSARMPVTEAYKMAQQLAYRVGNVDGSEKTTKAVMWAAAEVVSLYAGIPASRIYERWMKGQKNIENGSGWWGNHFIPQEKKKH